MLSIGLTALATLLLTVFGASAATAQTETVLYSFGSSGDGIKPEGAVVLDAAGNIYGTTLYGGASGGSQVGGAVFELSPATGGGWTETLLHSFSQGTDGEWPYGVIIGPSGSLYGTTFLGGVSGQGTVYELRPIAGGGWSKQILHSFRTDGKDGVNPDAELVSDSVGNLYGTTLLGGTYGQGTVFELLHQSGGTWAEKILYSFNNNGTDGLEPCCFNLVLDKVGNIYGTTHAGGLYNGGILFELMHLPSGRWAEKLLHSFGHGSDGLFPNGVVFDPSGNIYGTTSIGGAQSEGTLFKLSPKSGGGWVYTVPYSFVYQGVGGFQPISALSLDSSGNLYGSAQDGGTNGFGTVFELSPTSGGGWIEKALYSFTFNGLSGYLPGDVTLDSSGNIFGPTFEGGTQNLGTVFEIIP